MFEVSMKPVSSYPHWSLGAVVFMEGAQHSMIRQRFKTEHILLFMRTLLGVDPYPRLGNDCYREREQGASGRETDNNMCTSTQVDQSIFRSTRSVVCKLLGPSHIFTTPGSTIDPILGRVTSGQKIIVLRQDLSDQMKAEESLNRRTEEVVQAVSMLSARAARDIDSGGRGNAWGDWRRGQGRGTGRGGRGAGRHIGGPQVRDWFPVSMSYLIFLYVLYLYRGVVQA